MMIENEKQIAKVLNVATVITLIAIFCTLFARAINPNGNLFRDDTIRMTSCPGVAGYWIAAAVLAVTVVVLMIMEGKVNRAIVRTIKFVILIAIFILVKLAVKTWDEYYLAYYTQRDIYEAWSVTKGYFFRGEGFYVMNVLSYVLIIITALDAYFLPFSTFKNTDN